MSTKPKLTRVYVHTLRIRDIDQVAVSLEPDADGFSRTIATTGPALRPESHAFARRIAACLNACRGIPTEHLEGPIPIPEVVQRVLGAFVEASVTQAEGGTS